MNPGNFDVAEIARRARNIRRLVIEMLAAAGSGHPGGSLSAADIVAMLYFGGVMRHRPHEPFWGDRDRFVLSKGPACPVLYAALPEAGSITPDLLTSLPRVRTPLQRHTG